MRIHPEAQERNTRLAAVAPAVAQALSPLGQRAFFPKGIPFQAGQSAGCKINATIGQITDGAGNPIPLAPLKEKLASFPPKDAFLYSPIQGRLRAREAWHAKLVKEDPRMAQVALREIAAGNTDPFYPAKLQTARFYFAKLFPETATLMRTARAGSKVLMDTDLALA